MRRLEGCDVHWLEKNFANPVGMVQTKSGYLINIYGINIPNPEAVISILKGKPFNLDTFYITDQSSRYFNSSVEYWTKIKKQFPYFFNFSNNFFCKFPLDCWQVIKSMKQIREIDLDMNNLRKLPLDRWCEIASLEQLREFSLGNSYLNKLPESDPRVQFIRGMEKQGVKVLR